MSAANLATPCGGAGKSLGRRTKSRSQPSSPPKRKGKEGARTGEKSSDATTYRKASVDAALASCNRVTCALTTPSAPGDGRNSGGSGSSSLGGSASDLQLCELVSIPARSEYQGPSSIRQSKKPCAKLVFPSHVGSRRKFHHIQILPNEIAFFLHPSQLFPFPHL